MKPIHRQHLIATIFPASMLDLVRQQSQAQANQQHPKLVFLTGTQPITARRVRLIAEAFVRSGKTIRIMRTL
jgi:hypothetical protein